MNGMCNSGYGVDAALFYLCVISSFSRHISAAYMCNQTLPVSVTKSSSWMRAYVWRTYRVYFVLKGIDSLFFLCCRLSMYFCNAIAQFSRFDLKKENKN